MWERRGRGPHQQVGVDGAHVAGELRAQHVRQQHQVPLLLDAVHARTQPGGNSEARVRRPQLRSGKREETNAGVMYNSGASNAIALAADELGDRCAARACKHFATNNIAEGAHLSSWKAGRGMRYGSGR